VAGRLGPFRALLGDSGRVAPLSDGPTLLVSQDRRVGAGSSPCLEKPGTCRLAKAPNVNKVHTNLSQSRQLIDFRLVICCPRGNRDQIRVFNDKPGPTRYF
jgi:hypothetical protein